jgi:hypothetical protein
MSASEKWNRHRMKRNALVRELVQPSGSWAIRAGFVAGVVGHSRRLLTPAVACCVRR